MIWTSLFPFDRQTSLANNFSSRVGQSELFYSNKAVQWLSTFSCIQLLLMEMVVGLVQVKHRVNSWKVRNNVNTGLIEEGYK